MCVCVYVCEFARARALRVRACMHACASTRAVCVCACVCMCVCACERAYACVSVTRLYSCVPVYVSAFMRGWVGVRRYLSACLPVCTSLYANVCLSLHHCFCVCENRHTDVPKTVTVSTNLMVDTFELSFDFTKLSARRGPYTINSIHQLISMLSGPPRWPSG